MNASKPMELRWPVLIVAWAVATLIVPGGLAASIVVAIWLAWRRSPYLWFFVIAVMAVSLLEATLGLSFGGYAVSHHS